MLGLFAAALLKRKHLPPCVGRRVPRLSIKLSIFPDGSDGLGVDKKGQSMPSLIQKITGKYGESYFPKHSLPMRGSDINMERVG